MQPKLIKGNCYSDTRGNLKYNNDFSANDIKRIYIIENIDCNFKRGWQGHKIEQRWFSAITGSFKILLIQVNDWENPNCNLVPFEFVISSTEFDVIHIPAGYISCIQALEENSKLLVMANFALGEINDEYRYSLEQFNCTKNKC